MGKGLPGKYKEQCSISRTYENMPGVVAFTCKPRTEEAKTGGPLSLLDHLVWLNW